MSEELPSICLSFNEALTDKALIIKLLASNGLTKDVDYSLMAFEEGAIEIGFDRTEEAKIRAILRSIENE